MKTMLTVGCKSSHGGVIITGDPTAIVNGKPVARIGDLHACPLSNGPDPHSITKIVPAGNCINRPLLMGRPMAMSGDMTACGAVLLPGPSLGSIQC
jgi:uncharacterized Zn-binding protein involved in type VI secretion